MEEIENTVKQTNLEINDRFSKIIEKYRKTKRDNGEEETVFDKDGNLDSDIKEFLTLELKKCVSLYMAEFPSFSSLNVEDLKIIVKNEDQLEARGGPEGMTVYSGINRFINNALKRIDKKGNAEYKPGLEYAIIDGKTYVTRINLFNDESKGLISKEKNSKDSSEKMVDSQRDSADYFAELISEDKIDIDFICDVLPHEAMHAFGYPGNGVLVEGTTERLTRECADKFGLRLTPTSHQRETQIVAKLERIIGRENLASAMSLSDEEKAIREKDKEGKQRIDNIRLSRMRKLIDDKMGAGTFDKLQSEFTTDYNNFLINKRKIMENHTNFYANSFFLDYREKYYKEAEEILDRWITEHPDELFDYNEESENKKLSSELNEHIEGNIKSNSGLDGHSALRMENVVKYQQAEAEILSKMKRNLGIEADRKCTLQEIGKATVKSFSQNPERAKKQIDALEQEANEQKAIDILDQ